MKFTCSKLHLVTSLGLAISGMLAGCAAHSLHSEPNGERTPAAEGIQTLGSHQYRTWIKAIDMGFKYAYAPAIVNEGGKYHMFFCSAGGLRTWDYIRYSTSADGQTWSNPEVMLITHPPKNVGKNLAACDPSIMFYDGYYYLYISSAWAPAPATFNTVVMVARSKKIDGPYATYTERGNWEGPNFRIAGNTHDDWRKFTDASPTDPKVILYPHVTRKDQPPGYGAGEQSVIEVGGKFHMFYVDDSDNDVQAQRQVKLFHLTSTDPLKWDESQREATDLPGVAHSPDVKWDPVKNRFVMVLFQGAHSVHSSLQLMESVDGTHWKAIDGAKIDEAEFPHFANNPGISGDARSYLLPGKKLVGFAAPIDIKTTTDNFGNWYMYGTEIDF